MYFLASAKKLGEKQGAEGRNHPHRRLVAGTPGPRAKDGKVEYRPIAGTRPRGTTRRRRPALERELLADPKERAEHVMLVDLGRNDVGRVSEYRHGQRHRFHDRRALLARHAHRQQRRRQTATRSSPPSTSSAPASPPARSAARPKSAPWRSSRSWSRPAAASTAAPSATPASPATSIPCIAIRTLLLKDDRVHPGRRRHRRRLHPRKRIPGNAEQGEGRVRAVERAREAYLSIGRAVNGKAVLLRIRSAPPPTFRSCSSWPPAI